MVASFWQFLAHWQIIIYFILIYQKNLICITLCNSWDIITSVLMN